MDIVIYTIIGVLHAALLAVFLHAVFRRFAGGVDSR